MKNNKVDPKSNQRQSASAGANAKAKTTELTDTDLEKVAGGMGTPAPTIDVTFNPQEYSLDKSVSWQTGKGGANAPVISFTKPR